MRVTNDTHQVRTDVDGRVFRGHLRWPYLRPLKGLGPVNYPKMWRVVRMHNETGHRMIALMVAGMTVDMERDAVRARRVSRQPLLSTQQRRNARRAASKP